MARFYSAVIKLPLGKRSRSATPLGWQAGSVAASCWLYILALVAFWLYLRFEGDRTTTGALIQFSPRWLALLPLIVLIPLAAIANRSSLLLLTAGTWIALFPVMDLCLPWRSLLSSSISHGSFRVLSCNVHSHAADRRKLSDLIAATNPDIVCLQEWPSDQTREVFSSPDWYIANLGALCIASRYEIEAAAYLAPLDVIRCRIILPSGAINFIDLHLSSPHKALSNTLRDVPEGPMALARNIQVRRIEAQNIAAIPPQLPGPTLLAGDFNLTTDSSIYRDNFSSYSDAFSTAGLGFGWTYRIKWTATRIDHMLTDDRLICTHCEVCPNIGSPHRPLLAEFFVKF